MGNTKSIKLFKQKYLFKYSFFCVLYWSYRFFKKIYNHIVVKCIRHFINQIVKTLLYLNVTDYKILICAAICTLFSFYNFMRINNSFFDYSLKKNSIV